MNEEFEKEFSKLSEKDKREVNNLIRFMQEKKYHDKQYEELLNQYIELSRDYDYLQSKIDKAIEWLVNNIDLEMDDFTKIDLGCNVLEILDLDKYNEFLNGDK